MCHKQLRQSTKLGLHVVRRPDICLCQDFLLRSGDRGGLVTGWAPIGRAKTGLPRIVGGVASLLRKLLAIGVTVARPLKMTDGRLGRSRPLGGLRRTG